MKIAAPQAPPAVAPTLDRAPSIPWGKRIGLAAGPLAFALIAFVPSTLHGIPGAGHRPAFAAATVALMAIWWLSEAVPIAWTACLPLALYPLFGVFGDGFAANLRASSEPFLDAYLFMFLGGMMIGAAMEECGLHRRLALRIMSVVGTEPRRLLLGVITATAAVSLWISNTAAAVMMLPIAVALVVQLEAVSKSRLPRFGAALVLAVAYASNVGGIGTKIGTGTNSILCGFVQRTLGVEIGFMKYLAFGLPFVVLFVPVVWAVLWRLGRGDAPRGSQGREVLDRELASLGRTSGREKAVLAVFVSAALLWVLGDLLRPAVAPWGQRAVRSFWPGFTFVGKHYEAWVGMAAGLALLMMRLLSGRSLFRLPWGTLLLLGGSFAMASGIEGSRLSAWMSARLEGLAALPLAAQIGLAALASVGLSAVASNTGSATVLLNVLPRSTAVLSTVALGASCDFMLPAGTPPNAIVFGSGRVRLPDMMKTGFLLNMAAVGLATTYVFLYARHLFG